MNKNYNVILDNLYIFSHGKTYLNNDSNHRFKYLHKFKRKIQSQGDKIPTPALIFIFSSKFVVQLLSPVMAE